MGEIGGHGDIDTKCCHSWLYLDRRQFIPLVLINVSTLSYLNGVWRTGSLSYLLRSITQLLIQEKRLLLHDSRYK